MGTIGIQVATEAERMRKTQREKGGQETVRSRAEPRGMPFIGARWRGWRWTANKEEWATTEDRERGKERFQLIQNQISLTRRRSGLLDMPIFNGPLRHYAAS